MEYNFFPKYITFRERPFNLKKGGGGGGGYGFFSKKNILILNVAEKNILILVEEKKFLSYNLMLTSGKKIRTSARQKK